MNLVELPPLWRSRALVISDVPFERSWYTGDELAVAGSFHLQKRREEWLASRYAAKKLARSISTRRRRLIVTLRRRCTRRQCRAS